MIIVRPSFITSLSSVCSCLLFRLAFLVCLGSQLCAIADPMLLHCGCAPHGAEKKHHDVLQLQHRRRQHRRAFLCAVCTWSFRRHLQDTLQQEFVNFNSSAFFLSLWRAKLALKPPPDFDFQNHFHFVLVRIVRASLSCGTP